MVLGIGDAHALDELSLLAQALEQRLDLRPSSGAPPPG